ncbi:MAG TPA: hypothetical protein VMV94_20905 [Phycisphaerae bacterium]|nr:hypothetical protein [Phycisphaerae bacterium]
MNANQDDRTDEREALFFSAAGQEAAPPDEAFLKQLREQSTEAYMAAAAEVPPPARRYRIMNAKTLKWFLPIAAAAAIVLLAVGSWPGETKDCRVYAMADVPDLLRTSRTLHMKGVMYVPPMVMPGEKQVAVDLESWWDSANCRWRQTHYSYSVGSSGTDIKLGENVSDGEYTMKLNNTDKSVEFEKLDDFRRLLESRRAFDDLAVRLGQARTTKGFAKIGEEALRGETFDVWEGVFHPGYGSSYKAKWWLAPRSGHIARVQIWSQMEGASDWSPTMEYEVIERNVDPPPGVFNTSPPVGYALLNTKETAVVPELQVQGGGSACNISYVGHIAFELGSDAIILGWSSADANATESQADLFSDLKFGGSIPKVPFEVCTLRRVFQDEQVRYRGRHLAYTQTGDRYHEWALYVADREPPSTETLNCINIEQRYNAPLDNRWTILAMGISDPISIGSGDFDTLVRGAMAELSDGKTAPAEVTYENVMRLIEEARAARKAKE